MNDLVQLQRFVRQYESMRTLHNRYFGTGHGRPTIAECRQAEADLDAEAKFILASPPFPELNLFDPGLDSQPPPGAA